MCSTRQPFEDKFDRLIRVALKAQVRNEQPPDGIWKRLEARLEAECGAGPLTLDSMVVAEGVAAGVSVH